MAPDQLTHSFNQMAAILTRTEDELRIAKDAKTKAMEEVATKNQQIHLYQQREEESKKQIEFLTKRLDEGLLAQEELEDDWIEVRKRVVQSSEEAYELRQKMEFYQDMIDDYSRRHVRHRLQVRGRRIIGDLFWWP